MTAAALSRSRGVAGVRPTKGLFSIFTLLCLVCLSSSLIHKDQLEELKENFQKVQKQVDMSKAVYESGMAAIKDLMGQCLSLRETMEAFMKTAGEEFPEFPSHLDGYVQGVKGFVERTKNEVDKSDMQFRAQIENYEQKLESFKKSIKFLEEQQAEL